MEITEIIINEHGYAADCPEGLTVHEFLSKLAHDILFTPHSLRLIKIPGTNDFIDKADITSIAITVAR